MQKAIAKYGLAAHLAMLAVAPLFLFPFFGDKTIAVVLLWLSLPVAIWTFMQPSVRRGEMLHDARERVLSEVLRDPFFWVMLVVVLFTGLRAINSGVDMAYDAETSNWYMASPIFPLLPASVGDSGFLPFAASLACMVLVVACRHSLGRSARQAYFLLSSAMAGAAAALALFLANRGNPVAAAAVKCSYQALTFVGVAFAVHFASGIVAAVAALENGWNRAMPLLVLSVGGTAAGMIAFSPAYITAVFLVAVFFVFAYSFFYAFRILRGASEFKMLLLMVVTLLCGWVLVSMTVSSSVILSRMTEIADGDFFPEWHDAARRVVSAISLKAWMADPWTGTGVGSFALDMRFNATPSDWASIPRGLSAPPLGWFMLLTERGIAGAAMMALPFILMLVTYFARMVKWIYVRSAPQPGCWVGLFVVLAVATTGFFDCSYLRADVLMAVAGMLALSASTFPMAGKGGKNG